MPFKKLSITVEEALAEARAKYSGWRMLPELDNRTEAQGSGMDAVRLRQLQDEVARLPFPEDPAEHAAWYREIHARLDALGAFIVAVPGRSAFLPTGDRLRFDTGENPENVQSFWIDLKNLCAIADDFPPAALPFLRQCALHVCARDRWNGKEEGFWGSIVLGMYAVLAGADAVDDLLDEWRKLPPVASLANSHPYPYLHRHIAILLVLIAPPSRYPELAGILRAQFDAIGVQKRDQYGDNTPGQGTLGAIAYVLSIFDPESASAIKARSSEYGLFWRDVQWGLAGITPSKFADMLVYAGAIGPVRPVELQRALCFISGSYTSWIRELCRTQGRLIETDTDSYDKVHLRDQTYDGDGYWHALIIHSAGMTRPQIDLTHVHTQSIGLETIRFVHAENVFEFFLLVETLEGVACFNQFLECIGHPQRIFNIDDGGSWWEKETAALICADKARFPEILQQLNHGDDLDCKAEMPPLPTKSKILGDLCDMCISSDKFGNRSNLDYYGDCLVEYYTADPQENISLSTQILIAQALSLKAGYLQQLGSNAERQERHGYRAKERASYEFIIEHFEQHPALPETIGRAWSGLGRCFLLEAKSAWNDAPAARELLRKARTALETAHEKRLNSGAVLGNLAYALWLSGETKDAETTLRHAFSSLIESGEKLYEGMCSDIAAYPIPSDAGFKKTLDGYGKKLVPPHK